MKNLNIIVTISILILIQLGCSKDENKNNATPPPTEEVRLEVSENGITTKSFKSENNDYSETNCVKFEGHYIVQSEKLASVKSGQGRTAKTEWYFHVVLPEDSMNGENQKLYWNSFTSSAYNRYVNLAIKNNDFKLWPDFDGATVKFYYSGQNTHTFFLSQAPFGSMCEYKATELLDKSYIKGEMSCKHLNNASGNSVELKKMSFTCKTQ